MRTPSLAVCSAVLFASIAQAQLLQNINTLPQQTSTHPVDSSPSGFVAAGNRVYFSATTAATGREYYWVDASGAPAQLLADVAPGTESSSPRDLVQLPNGRLLFTAETLALGREVWVSDGTAAGTSLLVDLTGPGDNSMPQSLTVHQGLGYFLARSTGNFSLALWRTDGTTAGTVQIEDLGLTGSFAANAQLVTSTGAQLFYTAAESVWTGSTLIGTWRLHVTNGSVGGAQLLAQVTEPSPYGPRELTAVGSRVVWVAQATGTGLELWSSDGTVAGTFMNDLVPGAGYSSPSDFTTIGNQCFFSAYVSGFGGEVFVTDGTVAGTQQVTNSTYDFSRPLWLRAVGNQLAYVAEDAVHGYELWKTSATPGSEVLYADLWPGPAGGATEDFIAFGSGILCRSATPTVGEELLFTNGTPAGTFLFKDIAPGPSSSTPREFTQLGGQLFFAARDQHFGNELWVSDGTAVGTRLHTDLAVSPTDQSSVPEGFASVGSRVVFAANDGLSGKELWASDGTAAGTVRLTDWNGPGDSLLASPLTAMAFDGRVFLPLNDGIHGQELWISDGTAAGTQLFADLNPGLNGSYATPMIVWRGELYFTAGSNYFQNLYATDGTAVGTRQLTWLPGLWGSDTVLAGRAVEHGGRLYFAARTAATGTELWSTDGTANGTAMVVDLAPGAASSLSQLAGASLGNHVYFAAANSTNNQELWRTDGTPAGTTLVADLNPSNGSQPYDFHTIGQRVVFSAFVNGQRQYFGSDGVTVDALSALPLYVNGNWRLYANGTKLIGMLRGANGSFNLWGTDGTVAGSGVIKQIHPDGTEFVNYRAWRVSSGPKLLFLGANAAVGAEIFITDGTLAGTHELVDLAPGAADSHTDSLIRLGDALLFNAYDPAVGFELFRLPWTLVADWLAEPFGRGCRGSSTNAPAYGVSGSARLGATLHVEVANAAPITPVFHFWSVGYAWFDLGACSAYLATPVLGGTTVTDPLGATTLSIAVPNAPILIGVGVWMQSLAVDSGGEFLGIGALTPALELRISN